MRRAIEAKLDIDAIDIYGLSEIIGPGVAQECIETKDGLTVWEDHFYPGDRRPVDRRGAARRREGRARVHVADQGSAADDPLPHARPDPAAAADRALDAADGEDHRPLRRHDDHPRRQRLPDADRGADPEAAGARAALPARDHAAGALDELTVQVEMARARQRQPEARHDAARRARAQRSSRTSASPRRCASRCRAASSARWARPGAFSTSDRRTSAWKPSSATPSARRSAATAARSRRCAPTTSARSRSGR